jgi:NitT/TauT family transport system substrate-binding protein
MLAGNPEFARTKPIAAKRGVRAMLRASDLCLSAPTRVARRRRLAILARGEEGTRVIP